MSNQTILQLIMTHGVVRGAPFEQFSADEPAKWMQFKQTYYEAMTILLYV